MSEGIVWMDRPCYVKAEAGLTSETLYWFPNMLKKSNFELSNVQLAKK